MSSRTRVRSLADSSSRVGTRTGVNCPARCSARLLELRHLAVQLIAARARLVDELKRREARQTIDELAHLGRFVGDLRAQREVARLRLQYRRDDRILVDIQSDDCGRITYRAEHLRVVCG